MLASAPLEPEIIIESSNVAPQYAYYSYDGGVSGATAPTYEDLHQHQLYYEQPAYEQPDAYNSTPTAPTYDPYHQHHAYYEQPANEHQSDAYSSTPDEALGSATTTTSPAAIPPEEIKRRKLKQRRKRNTVILGVVGGTVGLVTLGPLGAVGLGVGSALVTKHASKVREKRVIRKMETRQAQERAGGNVPVYTGCVA